MMRITARERNLIFLTAAVAVVVIGYLVIVSPLAGRWRALALEARALQTELARHRLSIRQKEQIDKRYQELATRVRQSGSNSEQTATILQHLYEQYRSFSLTEKGTRVDPVEEGDFYRRFRIRLDLEGGVVPLADFLNAILSSPEPFRIEQLVVRATGGHEVVRASIQVSAVFAVSGG